MIRSILYMLVLLCLCSCRSSHISSYVSQNDTTYIHTINHDSIHTIDSVYIFQNDTTRLVYKSRNNYRYKVSHDTLYKVVRDTIYIKNDSSKLLSCAHGFSTISFAQCFTIATILIFILLFIYLKRK